MLGQTGNGSFDPEKWKALYKDTQKFLAKNFIVVTLSSVCFAALMQMLTAGFSMVSWAVQTAYVSQDELQLKMDSREKAHRKEFDALIKKMDDLQSKQEDHFSSSTMNKSKISADILQINDDLSNAVVRLQIAEDKMAGVISTLDMHSVRRLEDVNAAALARKGLADDLSAKLAARLEAHCRFGAWLHAYQLEQAPYQSVVTSEARIKFAENVTTEGVLAGYGSCGEQFLFVPRSYLDQSNYLMWLNWFIDQTDAECVPVTKEGPDQALGDCGLFK